MSSQQQQSPSNQPQSRLYSLATGQEREAALELNDYYSATKRLSTLSQHEHLVAPVSDSRVPPQANPYLLPMQTAAHAARPISQGSADASEYSDVSGFSDEEGEGEDEVHIAMASTNKSRYPTAATNPKKSRPLSQESDVSGFSQASDVSGFTSVSDQFLENSKYLEQQKHTTTLSEISSFSYANFQPHVEKQAIKVDRGSSWCCGDRNWPFYRRRYCGNKIGFFCMVVLVSTIVHTLWITPLIYCVVVPNMVQKTFEDGVKTLVITDPTPGVKDSNMHMYMGLPALTFIPGQGHLLPPTKIYASSSMDPTNVFAEITLPEVTFDLNKSANISIDANFEITNVLGLIMLVDAKQGTLSTVFLSTGWAIKLYGIQFYKSLQLHATMNLTSPAGVKV